MSDLFETYEEEFNDLKLSIEQRIRNIPTFDARKCFTSVTQLYHDKLGNLILLHINEID